MGKAKIEGCAGVAFFGKLEADLKALEWACKNLRLSEKYKLWIIHVNELNDASEPRERLDSEYGWDELETAKFKKNYPDYYEKADQLQDIIQRYKVKHIIRGVTYKGDNFVEALEYAIGKGLDTLVLGFLVAADGTKWPPINTLKSKGCSIVLAKVDVPSRNALTFSMASTEEKEEGSASAYMNQRHNGRETDTATRAEPSMPMHQGGSASSTPGPAAPPRETTTGSNSKPTPQRSDNAQPASSSSKTGTPVSASRP